MQKDIERLRTLFSVSLALFFLTVGCFATAYTHLYQEKEMAEQNLEMMRAARDIIVLAFFDADKQRPDLEKALGQLPHDPIFDELVKAVVAYRTKQPGGNVPRVLKALKKLDEEIGL